MVLGLYTKKELLREVNEAKVKSYKNGYEDAQEEINHLNALLSVKDAYIDVLIEENRTLKHKIREERHQEVRRIRTIARKTKKLRVKKKCQARIDKIYLGK